MGAAMRTKRPTSIRLSDDAELLRVALAAQLGVNKSAVVEMAIREMAERRGVKRKKAS